MTVEPSPDGGHSPSTAGEVALDHAVALDRIFGERSGLAERFVTHLSTSAVERGLIGPREVPRIWDRHVFNCAVLGEVLPSEASVADVGSGAGLPGLAVAIARPDLRVTLVEPLQRRVQWLEEVVADLGLDSVTVLRGRAEEVAGSLQVDFAMARAVAALPALAGWCLPLVRPGGQLVAIKGRSAAEELEDSIPVLKRLGAVGWEIRTCGDALLEIPTTVVLIRTGDGPTERSSGRRRHRPTGGGRGGGRGAGGSHGSGRRRG